MLIKNKILYTLGYPLPEGWIDAIIHENVDEIYFDASTTDSKLAIQQAKEVHRVFRSICSNTEPVVVALLKDDSALSENPSTLRSTDLSFDEYCAEMASD